MAKRSTPEPPKPPSISKSDGRRRLSIMIQRGETLLANRPLTDGQEDIWTTACIETIQAIFGEGSNHLYTFIGPTFVSVARGGPRGYDQYAEKRDADGITRRIGVLKTLIEHIDLEIGFEEAPQAPALSFWEDIHPAVARIAKPRYDGGQFADSVEAAFKEVNSIVKEHVKRKTGEELDGATLMNKAFSPKSPLIVLDDLSTESGRNTQLGYMQIYAGAMTGIRNPKAHANIVIHDTRARHFLFMASLLAYRFDERI